MDEDILIRWICVYDSWDGLPLVVVKSEDCKFEDLPDDGIQGFIKYFKTGGRAFVTGFDWYFLVKHPSGQSILSGNNHDAEDNKQRYPGIILKRGKHTRDDWSSIVDKLLLDN